MSLLRRKLHSTDGDEFECVYVNQDGSVRELSPKEKEYLNEKFDLFDGARPYIKSSYKSLDGWGSMSGFLPRKEVPSNVVIDPVNPQYDSLMANRPVEYFDEDQICGDITETYPDGSVIITPNRKLSREERFNLIKRAHLEQQRKKEALGK